MDTVYSVEYLICANCPSLSFVCVNGIVAITVSIGIIKMNLPYTTSSISLVAKNKMILIVQINIVLNGILHYCERRAILYRLIRYW